MTEFLGTAFFPFLFELDLYVPWYNLKNYRCPNDMNNYHFISKTTPNLLES